MWPSQTAIRERWRADGDVGHLRLFALQHGPKRRGRERFWPFDTKEVQHRRRQAGVLHQGVDLATGLATREADQPRHPANLAIHGQALVGVADERLADVAVLAQVETVIGEE